MKKEILDRSAYYEIEALNTNGYWQVCCCGLVNAAEARKARKRHNKGGQIKLRITKTTMIKEVIQ